MPAGRVEDGSARRPTTRTYVCISSRLFYLNAGCTTVGVVSEGTSLGHIGGRQHRNFFLSPPSFCGACFTFYREKQSAAPFHRQPFRAAPESENTECGNTHREHSPGGKLAEPTAGSAGGKQLTSHMACEVRISFDTISAKCADTSVCRFKNSPCSFKPHTIRSCQEQDTHERKGRVVDGPYGQIDKLLGGGVRRGVSVVP